MNKFYRLILILVTSGYSYTVNGQFLSLSWPLDRSVIQQAGGSASVYVAGQLVGCPDSYDRLQMRIEKLDKNGAFSSLVQDYTDISRDNGGMGLFREESYLQKGWYHIIVKAINSGSSIVAINDVKVGVGNVFIISGQSNASGISESGGVAPLLPTDVAYDCVVTNNWLGNCDWISFPAPAYIPYPVFPSFSKLTSTGKIAPNGYNTWAYSRLGNLHSDATNAPVAFFNTASQGTDIDSWKTSADGGSVTSIPNIGWPCNATMPSNSGLPYKRLKQSLNYYGGLFGTAGVLWHQGEAETAHKQSDPSYNSDYVNKLNYVISKSRTDFGYTVPWYVSKNATLIGKNTGGTWSGLTDATVASNQGTVAALNSNGATTDAISINHRHPNDKTHFNENSSNKGLTALANSWNTNIGSSVSGVAAQSLPYVSMYYNSSTDVYTATVSSGYSDYVWVYVNGNLDRGAGSGSTDYSRALAGSGMRCWVKNGSGNWSLTPIIYSQYCRSGARMSGLDSAAEKTDIEISYNFNVYPNPGGTNLRVDFKISEPSQVQVNLIDPNGVVLQNVVSNVHAKGNFTYPLNVSGLKDGTYYCQLKSGDISIIKRVIVRK
jgi:hypothetical protein